LKTQVAVGGSKKAGQKQRTEAVGKKYEKLKTLLFAKI
jgi:hypothetical protein